MASVVRKRLELIHGSHRGFLERTRQELSRAERYCLFLSLVLIDTSEFARAVSNRGHSLKIGLDTIYGQLETGLKNSLRNSDLVSPFAKHRLAVLLVETSRANVEAVRRRIEVFVRDYLRGELHLPFEPSIDIRTASFPEEAERFSSLTSTLNRP